MRFIIRVRNLNASEICPVADVFLRNANPLNFAHNSPLNSSILCACKTVNFILTIEALTRIYGQDMTGEQTATELCVYGAWDLIFPVCSDEAWKRAFLLLTIWYDMMWYDTIWYDIIYMIWYMIWYDIWYDTIRYNIWYDMIRYDMIRYMIWYGICYDKIRYDKIYDMIWYNVIYDTIRYDMIRYDKIRYMIWYMILYDIFVNCNWVATRWQQYSTHLHTNSTQNNTMKQNTQNWACITIRIYKHNYKNT